MSNEKRQLKIKGHPENLAQINLHAAGLDIGAFEIYACVPADQAEEPVRAFPTFTPDLYALADWLAVCGIDTVAMESTGVYWIPIYEILEERGFAVNLTNAQQLKNVPGKKSDLLDAQWIQQLHAYGLLQASFRPVADICALRALVRHRDNLLRYRTVHVQHMDKALQQMNLKLTSVLTDITGFTGLSIIRAILRGERDPHHLAQYRHGRCHHNQEEIAKALTGNYRSEHLFALQQAVELYDIYNEKMAACDQEIERLYATFEPVGNIQEQPLPSGKVYRKQTGNSLTFDARTCLYQIAGVDLTAIDGLHVSLVQKIISEIGVDMTPWPTVKHFASWLRLCPYRDISGGRVLRTKTKKTTNPATQAFRMAAQAVSRSDTALGAHYRRMRAKLGPSQAIVATAHKIARIVYHMLKEKTPYQAMEAAEYDAQMRIRAIKNLERKARRLGLQIVPTPT
jgi:transposase